MGTGMGAEAAAADPFPGGNSSFVILSVSVAGILAISILLLTYYLFLTRCASSWRHNNQLDDVADQRYVVYSPRLAPRRRGLAEAAIRRIPTLRYSHHEKAAAVASECAVCLGEFGQGERLRRLPACLHAFHIDCIDAWLHATANCPLCRADVVADHLVIDIASPPTAEVPAAARVAAMSMGEECIVDHERPCRGVQQQPMRRSLSLDSCSDKRLYLALQSALRRQQHHSALLPGEEEEEGAKFGESSAAAGSPAAAASGGRRLRRSFFSFSHGRSSRSAILPV